MIRWTADDSPRHKLSAPWRNGWLLLWLVALVLLAMPAERIVAAETSGDPSYAALADLLEDEEARNRLIGRLREMTPEAEGAATDGGDSGDMAVDSMDASIVSRFAVGLQRFTGALSADIASTRAAIVALVSGNRWSDDIERRWGGALQVFALTLLALLVAYGVLRLLASVGFARLNRWLHQQRGDPPVGEKRRRKLRRLPQVRLSRKVVGVLVAAVIDLTAVLLAALAGYLVAAWLAAEPQDTLFAFELLVAFVMLEAVKAVSRGIFATRYECLRLLPLEPETARYWNRWLSLVISLTGYCLLVVVPVTQAVLLPSVGRLLGLVIMLGVYGYAVGVIWRNRSRVRDGLLGRAEHASAAVFGTLIRVVARSWHILAIAYFTVLLVVSQADQQQALAFMMEATLQSVIAVGAGAVLAAVLSSLLMRHLTLPESWSRAFPSLEPRVNVYVPAALKGLRLLILIVVALVVLDAWRVFDLTAWLSSPGGQATLTMLFHVALVLTIAALSWTVVASLAIGFGAQKFVQDVITGVFIQLENGMNQNDIVEVIGLFGTVEKITIRSVALRSLDGGYHLIPFSAIDRVSNHTRGYGYHYGEYYVAYRESVDEAMTQLQRAFEDLMQDAELAPEILEQIEIPGVTSLDERGFRIRVMIKTTPGNQWAVQRAYNRLVKQRFDEVGIELPYPQTVLHFGRNSDGHAEPADARAVESLRQATDAPKKD